MDREELFTATLDRYLEPVSKYRNDPTVNEIMINGPDEIYIESNGKIRRVDAQFGDADRLMAFATNLAQYTRQRITDTLSRFDARLPDKSRVHVVLPRVSPRGLCVSIRKFSKKEFTLERYVQQGSLSLEGEEYIRLMVALEMNFIVSGGTGTGKTSFLNALTGQIPSDERIIVIEDTAELQPQQTHVLRFEAAAANRKGEGKITIRDLFHSSLRMRPDRIVIGECRGGEALDLIQAMTSGHGGSMSTLHASTPMDALHRLETMALMSGVEIPLGALRAQVASAINVVAQLTRLNTGERIISAISEVKGIQGPDYDLNPVFERKGDALHRTGNRSFFAREFRERGMTANLTKDIF